MNTCSYGFCFDVSAWRSNNSGWFLLEQRSFTKPIIDDTGIFATSLSRELALAASCLGMPPHTWMSSFV
jgi:hypothetical protein